MEENQVAGLSSRVKLTGKKFYKIRSRSRTLKQMLGSINGYNDQMQLEIKCLVKLMAIKYFWRKFLQCCAKIYSRSEPLSKMIFFLIGDIMVVLDWKLIEWPEFDSICFVFLKGSQRLISKNLNDAIETINMYSTPESFSIKFQDV